jgi:endonuclease/exonuclease/phosphatase family metal-dependent hydrolase
VAELTLLTYNVRGLRDDVGALVRVVRESGAHLVAMQETPKIFRWRTRTAELARRCGMVVVTGGAGAAGNLLLADLSLRVHATRKVFFPQTPGLHLRGAAVAEVSLDGRRVTVIGTHLSLRAEERARQARMLLDLAGADGLPAVLAGDLNEEPGGVVSDILAGRWVDAAVAAGDPGTPTFPARGPRRRIDYVWSDPRLAVRRHSVLDSADARVASDHLPVRVTLDLA